MSGSQVSSDHPAPSDAVPAGGGVHGFSAGRPERGGVMRVSLPFQNVFPGSSGGDSRRFRRFAYREERLTPSSSAGAFRPVNPSGAFAQNRFHVAILAPGAASAERGVPLFCREAPPVRCRRSGGIGMRRKRLLPLRGESRCDRGRGRFRQNGTEILKHCKLFHAVSQFADISRPVVSGKSVHFLLGKVERAASVCASEQTQIVPDKERNVFTAFPQGRNIQSNDADTVIEIFAERAPGARPVPDSGWWRPPAGNLNG